jgi:hypothetical protein
LLLLLVGVGILHSGDTVLALNGHILPWWTADGGGGHSQGGSYILSGTAGQPDAGALAGASYSLSGGFWAGAASAGEIGHLPLIVRHAP